MDQPLKQAVSKVPAVTLGFWIIKVIATTLGETGGDAVTMTWAWATWWAPRSSQPCSSWP